MRKLELRKIVENIAGHTVVRSRNGIWTQFNLTTLKLFYFWFIVWYVSETKGVTEIQRKRMRWERERGTDRGTQ